MWVIILFVTFWKLLDSSEYWKINKCLLSVYIIFSALNINTIYSIAESIKNLCIWCTICVCVCVCVQEHTYWLYTYMGFLGGVSGKEPTCPWRRHRDVGFIPGSGRSPGGGHANPLQYSCLENPMDRGAWQARVHRAAKSWTQLKQLSTCILTYWHVGILHKLLHLRIPRWLGGKEPACQCRRRRRLVFHS